MRKMTTGKRGFTLIELMIAVAILAIISAIAIPQYNRYAFRARRADGQKLLLAIANAEERYYAQQNKYADLKTIGFSSTATATSDNSYYTATVTATTVGTFVAQGFTATATPQGAQQKDVCTTLSITDTGAKNPSPTTKTSNGTCW
jgi:type IV pilus assembly protein PilE